MTIATQPQSDLVAAAIVRTELARRSWTLVDLSNQSGLEYGTVRNIVCGANQSQSERQRIESVLGINIWSSRGNLADNPSPPN